MKRVRQGVIWGVLVCGAMQAHAVGRLADVRIVDRDTGATLRHYHHRGEIWVAGTPGARYAIALYSRAGERVLDLQARLRARQRELEVASQRIQEDVDAAAGFQRGVPGQAKRRAADFGRRGERALLVAPGILLRAFEFDVQHHFLRDVLDGQVAHELKGVAGDRLHAAAAAVSRPAAS